MIRLALAQSKALVGLTSSWEATDVTVAARPNAAFDELGPILVRRERDQHAWIIHINGNINRLPVTGACS